VPCGLYSFHAHAQRCSSAAAPPARQVLARRFSAGVLRTGIASLREVLRLFLRTHSAVRSSTNRSSTCPELTEAFRNRTCSTCEPESEQRMPALHTHAPLAAVTGGARASHRTRHLTARHAVSAQPPRSLLASIGVRHSVGSGARRDAQMLPSRLIVTGEWSALHPTPAYRKTPSPSPSAAFRFE